MIRIGLFCSAVTVFVVGVVALAGAADNPPRVGAVSCGATGNIHFGTRLRFSAGRKPDRDTRARIKSTPAGCSGSQTGGNPHRPGPIDHAKFLAKGFVTGHTCSDLSAHGLRNLTVRVTWYGAAGANLGVTKITSASATVSGLGNGVPSNFPPPNNPPPGIVTFTLTGNADTTSSAFPGETLHASFVGDMTTEEFPIPCSNEGPPLPQGLGGFTFTGRNGSSTISIS